MRETLYAACVTNVSAALLTRVGSQSLDSERSAGSGGGQRAPKKAREEVSYYVPNTADQLKAARASIAQCSFDRCVCLARTCVVARSPCAAHARCDSPCGMLPWTFSARKRLRQEQTTTEEGDAKRAVDVAAVKLVRTVKVGQVL